MKRFPILEQHIHGAFGINFSTANVEEILFVVDKLYERGITGFFPTLVTDSVENINRQIGIIKKAALKSHRILGIHLEGIFINFEKKGIHNSDYFLELTVDNYKLIEDDFIKIVTLAPELDMGLMEYLRNKNVKVQAGHCVGWGKVDGVTHIFNGMKGINHRENSTALSALIDESSYIEVIADGVHLSDEILNLIFKSKSDDKIILISDALPLTNSTLLEMYFAGSKICYDGFKATSCDGTIAGSTMLLDNVIERLDTLGLFKSIYLENAWHYHGIDPIF